MRQTYNPSFFDRIASYSANFPRKTAVGFILVVALLAFEIFNFDTTRYALRDLLGEVRFVGIEWAAILAIAFCSIDFAGLMRIFTKEKGADEPKEVWYLMGAWLLGASMNAIMTWWAISLTLLENEFGNEVMSREELLHIVPIFVAVLVWLTRILFIGSFTVAGEHFFEFSGIRQAGAPKQRVIYREPAPQPRTTTTPPPTTVTRRNVSQAPRRITPAPKPKPQETAVSQTEDVPTFLNKHEQRELVYEDVNYSPATPPSNSGNSNRPSAAPTNNYPKTPRPQSRPVAKRKPAQPTQPRPSRIKQRPPMPNGPRRQ
jgi:hypothetical protein